MPAEIFGKVIVPNRGDYFSLFRTKITNAEILKTSLQQLGFTVKTNADVRGYMSQRVRADIVAILEGDYDLGWIRNLDGSLDFIVDLGGVSEWYDHPTELIQSILQQYVLNKTLAEQDTSEQDD
ncbi:MAG TPA: DUF1257 domain-containing protein [Stenomitos sp.]